MRTPYPDHFTPELISQLDRIFHAVMEEEGGFVDDPIDTGGATRYGISHKFLIQQFEDYEDVYAQAFPNEANIRPTKDTVRNITKRQAKFFFFEVFVKPILPLNLPLNLLVEVVDFGYNAGTRQTIKTLQRSLNKMVYRYVDRRAPTVIAIDGIWGKHSAALLKYHLAQNGKSRVEAMFRKERVGFYKYLVKYINPKYKRFIKGWTKRALKNKL